MVYNHLFLINPDQSHADRMGMNVIMVTNNVTKYFTNIILDDYYVAKKLFMRIKHRKIIQKFSGNNRIYLFVGDRAYYFENPKTEAGDKFYDEFLMILKSICDSYKKEK